jgi:hypothetical protein
MRPSYEELLALNPLLRNRSSEEVNSLLDAVEECGYSWDPSQMMFYNSEVSRGIRTQGLDMLTPDKFRKHHGRIYQEYAANPEQYNLHANGIHIWSRWVPRLMILFVINLLGGWLILPIKYWFISLGIIIVLYFFMKSFFVNATRQRD